MMRDAQAAVNPADGIPPSTPERGVVQRAFDAIAATWRELIRRDDLARIDPSLPPQDEARVRAAMAACLSGRGESTTRAATAALGALYAALAPLGRSRFLELLATFDVDRAALDRAIAHVQGADGATFGAALQELQKAARAPWLTILQRFNSLPQGTKFLVDMRADLLDSPALSAAALRMDNDLRALLRSWFDIGFLELRRITWEAPAVLLERIARYESVHEVRSWLDLKDRLDTDRRCYAYLHPAMPDEPLIFVEIALVRDVSDRIAPLLDPNAPRDDTGDAMAAVFYSISACQRGLAGISLGNALIKRVVQQLGADFPHVRRFATLSPIPGFRAWLRAQDGAEEIEATLERRHWYRDAKAADAVRRPLLALCARYLLETKARDGGPRDPVARFHLANGARMERLNWLADTAPRALAESAGMMINYEYRLADIDANQDAYAVEKKIAVTKAVRDLLSG